MKISMNFAFSSFAEKPPSEKAEMRGVSFYLDLVHIFLTIMTASFNNALADRPAEVASKVCQKPG